MRALVSMLLGAVLALPSAALGQREGAEAAIRRGAEAWTAAWSKGDAAAIAALYAEDAVVMAPGSEPAAGRTAIEALWKGALQEGGGSKIVLKPLEVMAGDGWAAEVGSYVETAADGSHRDHGRYIVVWKNVAGKWMLYRDIWNSSM